MSNRPTRMPVKSECDARHRPACLAMVGGSMVQKKTGSGTSTPDRITLACWLRFVFCASLSAWARRAAAAAAALDDTMVSPVTVWRQAQRG